MKFIKPVSVVIAIAAFQVSAETAYRSVDDQGNVTYSDRPVKGAVREEQIRVEAPAPSAGQKQDAMQREAELEKAAGQTGVSPAPDRASQKKSSKRAVQDAEKQLEEAVQVREGDRIGTAGGGSRLTPEYHERVRKAEEEVDRAREQAK
jgi:hypothetical protein